MKRHEAPHSQSARLCFAEQSVENQIRVLHHNIRGPKLCFLAVDASVCVRSEAARPLDARLDPKPFTFQCCRCFSFSICAVLASPFSSLLAYTARNAIQRLARYHLLSWKPFYGLIFMAARLKSPGSPAHQNSLLEIK